MEFRVVPLNAQGGRCIVHEYRVPQSSRLAGAYDSDCTDWPRQPPLYFFFVRIRNGSLHPLHVTLSQFFVVDQARESHQPTEVTGSANSPEQFLPADTNIAPRAALSGWLAFNAARAFTPRSFLFANGGRVWRVFFPRRQFLGGGEA